MTLQDLDDHPLRTTFYHEAGHAVVGVLFGVKCDCIGLKAKRSEYGNELAAIALEPTRPLSTIDWAAVQFGGYAAELVCGVGKETALRGAKGDVAELKRDLVRFFEIRPEDVEETYDLIWERGAFLAKQILTDESHWRGVQALAVAQCDHFCKGEDFIRAPEIYSSLTPYVFIEESVRTTSPGDPCVGR